MRGRTTKTGCLLIALLSCAQAWAQGDRKPKKPLTKQEGREKVFAFLTRGKNPPRPRFTRRQLARMQVEVESHFAHGSCLTYSLRQARGRGPCLLMVQIDRTSGAVIDLYQVDREFTVAIWDKNNKRRSQKAIKEEIEGRTTFSKKELRKKAKASLAQFLPDLASRRFKLVRERKRQDSLVRQEFTFVEQPTKGVLALLPNVVHLSFSPETGALVAATLSNLRVEVRKAPKVSQAAAVKVARRVTKQGTKAKARATLFVQLVRWKATTRVAWEVVFPKVYVIVDARTGKVVRSGRIR